MVTKATTFLDCTLRDGGYYNDWDFSLEVIKEYLLAMAALRVDYVEIGFRSLKNEGFKGGCAFSTEHYLTSLNIPLELKGKLAVMVNAMELLPQSIDGLDETAIQKYQDIVLRKLFKPKKDSLVSLVRIACHVHEFSNCLYAARWLKAQGYKVGFNLMQVTDRTDHEITQLARLADKYPIDVLYFADSMGSLNIKRVSAIIRAFKKSWTGQLGIHAHDSMGQAVANSLQAIKEGVTWVDGTVTGMGRGPGNAQTEYLTIALENCRVQNGNITKLLEIIRKHFKPMQLRYGWGCNPYYYLAGKHSIHPSFVQEMLADSRYNDEDILAVINHLKIEGGKKFCFGTLEAAKSFYRGEPRGFWRPVESISDRDVLIVGSGPSLSKYRASIEALIEQNNLYVIALNAQESIDENLIDVRAACHPVRLLADCREHLKFSQPLITPASMLPEDVQQELSEKELLDFGIEIKNETFEFHAAHCILPVALVVAYALAIATSGRAKRILLVGFDGYPESESRNQEMSKLFKDYSKTVSAIPVLSLTPSLYHIPSSSIFGVLNK